MIALSVASVCALAVAAIACATDLRSARIPNWLTFAAAAGGLAFHTVSPQGMGLGSAVMGLLVGLAVFFPFFVLRAMGAGDVKLLAALGAWLGVGPVLWVALYTSIAGGAFAIVISLAKGYLGQALRNIWALIAFWRVVGIRPLPSVSLDSPHAVRLPYALPIATGLVLTLWLR